MCLIRAMAAPLVMNVFRHCASSRPLSDTNAESMPIHQSSQGMDTRTDHTLHLRDRRLTTVPVGLLLIGVRHPQHRSLVKCFAGDLQPDRQPSRRETAGDRDSWRSRQIKRAHQPQDGLAGGHLAVAYTYVRLSGM